MDADANPKPGADINAKPDVNAVEDNAEDAFADNDAPSKTGDVVASVDRRCICAQDPSPSPRPGVDVCVEVDVMVVGGADPNPSVGGFKDDDEADAVAKEVDDEELTSVLVFPEAP